MVIKKVSTHVLGDRRVGQFTDLKTMGTKPTLQEAIDFGYVKGLQIQSLLADARGVLKCMLDNIARDGNGRKIDEYISINPFARGRLADVTDEYTRADAHVVAVARMLKEFRINTGDWSFVIEGSVGDLVLDAITTGEKIGEIALGRSVMLNGRDLALGADDSVSWTLQDGREGSVSADLRTSDASRITLAPEAFAGIFTEADIGKIVKFTVRAGNRLAVKSATIVA